MTTQPTTAPSLADIAAAQASNHFFAFDRNHADRELARLQALYARRRAQFDVLAALFDEGTPEITLRGETQQLTLRGALLGDTYTALSEALSTALAQLEKDIVQAHLSVAEWAADIASDYADRIDYAPLVQALCEPAGPRLVAFVSPTTPPAAPLALAA